MFDVSVVIPLHNKARFIAATMATVLEQSLKPCAIIVVDDGSTDCGVEFVEEVASCNPGAGIRLVRQPNAGPGPARNRGIAEARSEWVALLDGDDLWRPDHLKTLAEVAHKCPQADVLATGFRVAETAEEAVLSSRTCLTVHLLDLFATPPDQSPLWTSCVAIRRNVVKQSGGFGAFWPGEDFELWARLALQHDIACTDHVTATYVQNTGGLMEKHIQAGGGGAKLQPIFVTLDAALADARYVARRPAVLSYRGALLKQVVRQALFRGEPKDARNIIAVNPDVFGAIDPLRVLSLLPQFLLIWALKAHRRITDQKLGVSLQRERARHRRLHPVKKNQP